MRLCQNCGNEIADNLLQCRHCGSCNLEKSSGGQRIATVNIKNGMPTVEEALRKLKNSISSRKKNGVRILRVIHGYGSTGAGGKIGREIYPELSALKSGCLIKDFIPGSEYSKTSPKCRELLKRFPELEKDYRKDERNKGSTLVIIS